MSDAQPLLTGMGKVLGMDVKLDDDKGKWCFVLPMITEANKADFETIIPKDKAASQMSEVFTQKAKTEFGTDDLIQKDVSKKDLHEMFRAKFVEIACSPKCGFDVSSSVSIDGDELFIYMDCSNLTVIQKLAGKLGMRIPIKPQAYPKDQQCPTTKFSGGFIIEKETFDPTYTNHVPIYLGYDETIKDKFQDFREVEVIRLIKRRLMQYMDLGKVEDSGFTNTVFPIHKYDKINRLNEELGWSKISACFRIPTSMYIEVVRDYFGEELGFFFQWFAFYTRWMLLPAIVGLACFFRHFFFDLATQRYIQIGFSVFMMAWAAVFTASFKQQMNEKVLKWGMNNYSAVAPKRKAYIKAYRGTYKEAIQNSLHWILAALFMIEALAATAFISKFRMQASQMEPDAVLMGMSATMANKIGKYLVTINIKIVDQIWARLSPYLSRKENWPTDQELKVAKTNKLFCVKFIIYYYPFFYIAFMQEHIEGCHPKATGCIDALVENLAIFFVTHIATIIAMMAVSIAMTYRGISSEIKAGEAKDSTKKYTYVQAQSKFAPDVSIDDDMLELVLSLGFVMMFAVVLPVMATLAFFCNLLEYRLIAYRTSFVDQRADPRGQEGIGAWSGIIQIVSLIAVSVNIGMACFAMHPIKDHPMLEKLFIFILGEHMVLFIVMMFRSAIPPENVTMQSAVERNNDVFDDIYGAVDVELTLPKTDGTKCLTKME